MLDQSGVDVELGHIIDDDGDLEALFILQDMFQQCCLAGPQEATQQRDGKWFPPLQFAHH